MRYILRIISSLLFCIVATTAQASFISTVDVAGNFALVFPAANPFDTANNSFTINLTSLTNSSLSGPGSAVINVPPPGFYDANFSGTVDFRSGSPAGDVALASLLAGLTGTTPGTFPLSGALSLLNVYIDPAALGITSSGIYTYNTSTGQISTPGGGTTTTGNFNISMPGAIPNPNAAFSLATDSMTIDVTPATSLAGLSGTCTPSATLWCGLGVSLAAGAAAHPDIISGTFSINGSMTLVPEPASLSLLALGLVGFAGKKYRSL